MNRWFVLAFAVMLAVVQAPRSARAGEFDLVGSTSGFTSAGNAYGPWQSLAGSFRWVDGRDTPSVSLVDRVDHDRFAPTHSFGVTVDDYHDWSRTTYTYAALGASAGTVLPNRNAYVEVDRKFGATLATVAGGGVGIVVNPNGVVQRYLNVGPAFYGHGFNVTLRYLQTFTTGRTGAGTAIATATAGRTGATLATLLLLAGNQPPNGIAAATQPAVFGQRTVLGSLRVKHWTGRDGGFVAGVEIERLNDRSSGTLLYARRGISIGIFRDIGPALP